MFTPEHLHTMLNHLPPLGLLVCTLFLLYGLVRKNEQLVGFSKLLIVLFAVTTPLVMMTGEQAEERFEHGSGALALDPAGKTAMEVHERQAKLAALGAYALAAVTVVVLVAGRCCPARRATLSWLVVVGVCVVVGAMAWAANSGGQIRHPEFRPAAVST